jgi:hypothetical protein
MDREKLKRIFHISVRILAVIAGIFGIFYISTDLEIYKILACCLVVPLGLSILYTVAVDGTTAYIIIPIKKLIKRIRKK